jgi:hypothetical protein
VRRGGKGPYNFNLATGQTWAVSFMSCSSSELSLLNELLSRVGDVGQAESSFPQVQVGLQCRGSCAVTVMTVSAACLYTVKHRG